MDHPKISTELENFTRAYAAESNDIDAFSRTLSGMVDPIYPPTHPQGGAGHVEAVALFRSLVA